MLVMTPGHITRKYITMNHIRIETKSLKWSTSFNGTLQAAVNYFMDNYFNVGSYPIERMEKVISVIELK